VCPSCGTGTLSLRLGRNGAFVGCSNYPECRYTRPLNAAEAPPPAAADGPIGTHPDLGAEIHLKDGRFGPYLEMQVEGEEKPRRSSIPKGWDPTALSLEQAVALIDLPREIGVHPQYPDSEPIVAGLGRYGPFVRHEKLYANLESAEEIFEIGLNRAVDLIEAKRANPRGRGQAAAPLKALGEHPELGGPVNVMSGRYGPYVKHDKINATLPKSEDPETITLERAVELIAEKAAKSGKGAKKSAAKKPAAKKKPTAKKTASKKTSAKKTSAAKSAS